MTEPKVVHEWTDKPAGEQQQGERYRITETFPAPFPYHNLERLSGGTWELVSYGASPMTREIAALAERVRELEEALGKCREGSAIRTKIESKRKKKYDRLRAALDAVHKHCEGSAYQPGSYLSDKVRQALKEAENG